MDEHTTNQNQNDSETVRPMSEDEKYDYHGITVNENGEKEDKEEDVRQEIYVGRSWWSLLWQYFKHLPLMRKIFLIAGVVAFVALCIVTAWFMLFAGGFLIAAVILVYIIHKLVS